MEWSSFFREIGAELSEEQLRTLDRLSRMVLRYNRKQNLVSKNDEPHLLERHIQDSLTPLFWISSAKGPHLDLGSGTGFPLLPLAIAQPHREFVGIEPRTTRVLQVRHIAGELGLRNIRLVEGRGEELSLSDFGGVPFTTGSARAVGSLEEDALRIAPFLINGGLFVTFKSSSVAAPPPFFRMKQRNYRLHPELKLYTSVCLEKIG